MLDYNYFDGLGDVQQDHSKAMELYARAADLGFSKAHYRLGVYYHKRGDLKMAKFHYGAAAMAEHKSANGNFGILEAESGNMEQDIKHLGIAASAG